MQILCSLKNKLCKCHTRGSLEWDDWYENRRGSGQATKTPCRPGATPQLGPSLALIEKAPTTLIPELGEKKSWAATSFVNRSVGTKVFVSLIEAVDS